MHTLFVKERMTYNGKQLSSLWAFRNWGLQGDCIIIFRGPCSVKTENLVDMADFREKAFIYSKDMLHFIVEHFDMDLEKTICRQRLLVSIIKDKIEEYMTSKEIFITLGANLRRDGDDLFIGNKKLSVSIATISPVSTMIHTGLNVSSKCTPVPAIGLSDMGYKNKDITALGKDIGSAYVDEIKSIKLARCKVRGIS